MVATGHISRRAFGVEDGRKIWAIVRQSSSTAQRGCHVDASGALADGKACAGSTRYTGVMVSYINIILITG